MRLMIPWTSRFRRVLWGKAAAPAAAVPRRSFNFGVDHWSEETAKEIERDWMGDKIQSQIRSVKYALAATILLAYKRILKFI